MSIPVRAAVPTASRTRASAPLIRPMRFADYGAIAALHQANGLKCKPRAEWEHLWTGNPAVKDAPAWVYGSVLEDERGEIVGCIGSIPFHYYFGGAKYTGATACGWVVDPRYRGYSILLLAGQVRRPGIDVHFTTTPSLAAASVYARLGFSAPPTGQWDRAALWVAGLPGIARRSCGARRWQPRKLGDGVELECRREFDSSFDDFWRELKIRKPRMLLASREKAVLDWHFRYAIERDALRVIAACREGRLLAYAILLRRDTRQLRLRRALLVDYQELAPRPGLCAAMLDYAIECCRRDGASVVENAGCWIEQPGFSNRAAPFHRSFKCPTYLYSAPNRDLQEALRDPSCWHPTHYDGDASL
jgi:hypothetical protein